MKPMGLRWIANSAKPPDYGRMRAAVVELNRVGISNPPMIIIRQMMDSLAFASKPMDKPAK